MTRYTLKQIERFIGKDKFKRLKDWGCYGCRENHGLHLHHRDENKENNEFENLCFLCGTCHTLVHIDNVPLAFLKQSRGIKDE